MTYMYVPVVCTDFFRYSHCEVSRLSFTVIVRRCDGLDRTVRLPVSEDKLLDLLIVIGFLQEKRESSNFDKYKTIFTIPRFDASFCLHYNAQGNPHIIYLTSPDSLFKLLSETH